METFIRQGPLALGIVLLSCTLGACLWGAFAVIDWLRGW